tara:strand:- start:8435 stop:9721 length:1287 start_codon:yes stop_codon:yes gene_type:complete
MLRTFLLLSFFISFSNYSQPNTDVFLFNLNTDNGKFVLTNMKNISNNEGYDNQPSFLDNNTILYAGTRNGQTDIVKYNINYDSKIFINHTEGGEYSPLKIPNKNEISAVRLDPDGLQRLYAYNLKNGESIELIKELVVAYYTWYDENTIVCAAIEDNGLNLYVVNIKNGTSKKYQEKVGRSFHKIPNSNLVSYISKEDDIWQIKSLNPKTGATKVIANTIEGVEDICWLNSNTIISGKEGVLYKLTLQKDNNWKPVADLSSKGISKITRIATNLESSMLLIAGDVNNNTTDETKLEPKLENIAWISGTWHGEAFGGITEEIWSEPSGGSMMASFKLIKDGKVAFYEIEIIREIENSLVLQLKHFNNDLKGWETKDETVDFPLKEITPNKVVFEGMTFEKVNNKEMNIYVDIEEKGKVETVKFNYKKNK